MGPVFLDGDTRNNAAAKDRWKGSAVMTQTQKMFDVQHKVAVNTARQLAGPFCQRGAPSRTFFSHRSWEDIVMGPSNPVPLDLRMSQVDLTLQNLLEYAAQVFVGRVIQCTYDLVLETGRPELSQQA